ncbi:MAG: succinate dehydrogenase/fumarate reductase iron-sulfur subunit [Syntrophorhabdus sp. PtaU1.Bin058]|nr:MAG: succinate dehydrogenase/fumarate reductase iron-sulfur subunit [Syntrophorhabdus sp. PtaU1.Bin058]
MIETNLTERLVFWLLFLIALGTAGWRYASFFRLLKKGRGGLPATQLLTRFKGLILYVAAQWSCLKNTSRNDLAGAGHFFIFWGTLVLAVTFILHLFIGDGLGMGGAVRNTQFSRVMLWLSEVSGILLLISILAAVFRRAILKPKRLGPNLDTGVFLAVACGIFLLLLCYFSGEALRIKLGIADFRTPLAGFLADGLSGSSLSTQTLSMLLRIVWWAQYLILLAFIVYAPNSHHKHPFFSPINIFFRSFSPIGRIEPVDFSKEERFGAAKTEDLTRGQLMYGFACAHCGRCQDSCPAHLSGKPLSPKQVILDTNTTLLRSPSGEQSLPADVETLLSCTTCGACVDVCPVFNRPLDYVTAMRRNLVYEGIFDNGHRSVLRRVARDFNPWGVKWTFRGRNIDAEQAGEGEKYDCIYWLGCAAAFDDRARQIANATMAVLKASGLRYAVLGTKEKCCGDFPRRIGDEGLFQHLAFENIETLSKLTFDFILTHCPHCLNTLSNEYRDFGSAFRVRHHSEVIAELLEQGRVRLQEPRPAEDIIYHDPCYLGRYRGIYEEPRKVLAEVFGRLLEFPRHHAKTFCCGAGGGHMWKEQESGSRISVMRLREALDLGPKIVATSCPFCLLMFEEALQIEGKGHLIKVRDIAEVVQQFLRYP